MDVSRSAQWPCYRRTRVAVSLVATVTDLVVCCFLVTAKEWISGGLVLGILVFSFVLAVISVQVKRYIRGYQEPMPCHKWCLLSVCEWGAWGEPIFNSGPQFVVQLALVWRAVRVEPVSVVFDEALAGSWLWIEGIFIIVSLTSSFLSVLVTGMYHNRERGGHDASRFFSAALSMIFCALVRCFLLSAISTIKLVASLPSIFIVYAVNVILIKYMNREGWQCLVEGYVSLLLPMGHARVLGSAQRQLPTVESSSACEVERVKVNLEKFFVNCRLSYASFAVLTLLLIVLYASLAEVYLDLDSPQPWFFERRTFLYITPAVLSILCMAFSSWHLQRLRAARDAARTWNALTPRGPRSTSVSKSCSVSVPMPQEAVSPTAPVFADVGDRLSQQYVEQLLPRPDIHYYGTYRGHEDGECVTCEILIQGPSFQSTMTGKQYKFMTAASCTEKNVVYLVTCCSCSKQYVGKTEQELKQRHYGHRREIETKMSNLGRHFSESCGYTSFRLQIIDQILEDETTKRKKELQRREGYWMNELMTMVPMGLNARDESSNL